MLQYQIPKKKTSTPLEAVVGEGSVSRPALAPWASVSFGEHYTDELETAAPLVCALICPAHMRLQSTPTGNEVYSDAVLLHDDSMKDEQ
jgi:hypothetical protein